MRSPEKYPLSKEWKEHVRAELAQRGRGAQAKLARAIGCSTGQLSELLNEDSKYSHLVPKIAEFFGWEKPRPPVPGSPDTSTIRYLIDRANDEQRRYLLDAAHMLLDAPEAEQTRALTLMLRMFSRSIDPLKGIREHPRVLVIDADERFPAPNDPRISIIITDNAIDGMLLVGTTKPHMVILDERLGAVELCKTIRANPDTQLIHVVISANDPSPRLTTAARNAGAWQVAPKPVDVVRLLSELSDS